MSKNWKIPLSEPEISGNEWKYIKECLDTGWVSSVGDYVEKFEKMLASYSGTGYAVATVNGTSALHISLVACGISPGDEVIVPALTFIAPVNAVRYCGAYPVFMDCDKDTLCIDVKKISEFIKNECKQGKDGFTYNRKSGRKVKAIIPVHIFGHPADMDPLLEVSKKYNIHVIEDATESLGSEYKGKRTGSFGRIGCFSFNGNKIITTGGGGMVVTNDKRLSERIRHLCTQAKKDPLEYYHNEIGYNYRLTNIQAAMGVAQLERIQEFVNTKRKNASIYSDLLSEIKDVKFLWENKQVKSNFWFYTIKVAKRHKKKLIKYLLSRNIQVRPVWKLIHTLPMYKNSQTYRIENAVKAYETCINLPCSVNLTSRDIVIVVENIKNYFNRN
ncbi:aminotransferase DegT [Dissulfurispira thermophila]|uniref:GDP-perosamine synthase n=1 Tax=Dissulfurispira thermophila TaxID=2715679 RepID=A0A7G1H0L9_9BACT|nr:LegC family aminotransferase [Dissulfurispira thermophila]BCB96340.1 aminotransferase DegT [Dissulfurispira thermophila]